MPMDPRQTREALLQAVNAHDIVAIGSFVAPSYVARNESGRVVMEFRAAMEFVAGLFERHPEYRETLVIEAVEEEGDTARRTEAMKGFLGIEYSRDARQIETWVCRDGRWVLVEERAD